MFMKSKHILLAISLSLILLMNLAGCSNTTKPAESSKQSAAAQSTSAPQKSEADKKASEPEFTLKFGHVEATTHAFQQASDFFASEVNKRTNGRVKVSVFPGAQLGNEMTMLDSMRVGSLDFAIITTANLTGHVPEMAILSVPYMYKNADHIYKVATDKVIFDKYSKLVEDKKLGFKLLSFLPNGLRNLYSTKEVKTIKDVDGLKVRVMAAPIEAKIWQSFGAKPVTMPFGEVYTALQTNLVQGAENSASSYLMAKHNEVAKFYNKTGHEWNFCEIFVADKTWSKLPDDIKKIINEVLAEDSRYGLDRQLENDKKALEDMAKGGVKVVDTDVTAFREKVLPVQDQVAKEAKAEDVLKRIRELEK